jgi:hypothetical protein
VNRMVPMKPVSVIHIHHDGGVILETSISTIGGELRITPMAAVRRGDYFSPNNTKARGLRGCRAPLSKARGSTSLPTTVRRGV